MDSLFSWFDDNCQWVFSGVGVAALSGLYTWLRKSKKAEANSTTITPVMQQKQKLVVNVNPVRIEKNPQVATSQTIDLKAKTHILFVDDEDFTVVKLLKNAGWGNTKLRRKISNVDDSAIIDAHIIFVDIVGVCGDLFKDEGLGLARALKEKYPDKKIIIYSGETQGDRFDKTLRMVDECLPKNAEFYQFLSLVDQFANEIWKKD